MVVIWHQNKQQVKVSNMEVIIIGGPAEAIIAGDKTYGCEWKSISHASNYRTIHSTEWLLQQHLDGASINRSTL